MLRTILKNPRTFFLKQSLSLEFVLMKIGSVMETVKVCFTNCHNTQLFINIGVLLIKLVKEGDISTYIHGSLSFKSRRDLDININIESLSIELISKNSKDTVDLMVILKLLIIFWKIYIPLT